MYKKMGWIFLVVMLIAGIVLYFMLSRNNKAIPEQQQSNQNKNILIEELSLEEKIGQMLMVGLDDTTLTETSRMFIKEKKVGGIILYAENLLGSYQSLELLNQIKAENKENRIPLLLGVDQEGGQVSRLPNSVLKLPTNEEIGRIDNSLFSFEIGKLLGDQLSAFGFNLDFAPVLDVNNNPNNPIINNRSFGDQADLVSELGIATMKGIQSQKVMSVIKHFPGHGDTSVDSHLELPVVQKSLEELNQLELIPFKEAIDQGADIVMVAHILIPELDPVSPSSMSNEIISQLLRSQLGFTGVVITDDLTMKAITNHYDIGDAAVQSVNAGSDIILVSREEENIMAVLDALMTAVESGEISEERIDESVKRILWLKKKYNIEDRPIDSVDVDALNQSIRAVLNKYFDQ
ncbi:beta-N-acetylhexosaminidase [Bacillus niameyensis]|uniref:beta-N-acetylhexosaminidase n=1 Tax=Bacillus niameyensis TaxID=1522308 RepID=UPI000780C181|nr:beta-N-acetylhexosaminidase [Bacillus niameyensis]